MDWSPFEAVEIPGRNPEEPIGAAKRTKRGLGQSRSGSG